MDDPLMDAAGRAVALQEELVAELQRDISAPAPDGQPPPANREEYGFALVDSGRAEPAGARSLEEAKGIAKEGFAAVQEVLEGQKADVARWLQSKEERRRADSEAQIARIKAGLNAAA